MSRVFEAMQATLKKFPSKSFKYYRWRGVAFFLGYCEMSEEDFENEYKCSVEHYIYGNEQIKEEANND